MTSTLSAFNWRGASSETGKALGRTQRAPKKPAPPITYSKKPAHLLRPLDRTQSTNTERPRAKPVYSAE